MVRELVLSGLVIAGGVLVWIYDRGEIAHPPGVLVPGVPAQTLSTGARAFQISGHRLTPLATYRISARVLNVRRYTSDALSALSPVDLALGWRDMSDTALISTLRIDQFNRFFWLTSDRPFGRAVMDHSANVHIIPANDEVRAAVLDLRPGALVTLSGKLVRIDAADGRTWTSSLTRTDSGPGGCEILYVERVAPYPGPSTVVGAVRP